MITGRTGLVGALALAAMALLVTTCSSNKSTNAPPPATYSHLVTINNFAFSPTLDTVSVGDTVTWRNDQGTAHTVTSDSGTELNSPSIATGAIYQHAFAAAGTHAYHCSIHTYMHGTIVVIPHQITYAVSMSNLAFVPASITVPMGATVTWTNNDTVAHTVTADDNSFDSGLIAAGHTFSHQFTAAGSVTYHCTVHPTMHGVVVVQ